MKQHIGVLGIFFLLFSCKDPLVINTKELVDASIIEEESSKKQNTEVMKNIIEQEIETKIFTTIKVEEIKNPKNVLKRLKTMNVFLWKYLEEGVMQFIDGDYVQVDEDRTILTMEDIDVNRYMNGLAYRKAGLKKISREDYRKQIQKYFGFDILNKENHMSPYQLFGSKFSIIGDTAYEPTEEGYFNYVYGVESNLQLFDIENGYFNLNRNRRYFIPEQKYLLDNLPLYDTINQSFNYVIFKIDLERCKFILHDDATSLSWLMHYDYSFCAKLIGTFGYLENSFLNAFVLNKQASMVDLEKDPESIVRISALIKHINASDGAVVIHEKLMQYIYEHTTQEDNTLLKYLDLSATMLINEKDKETQLLRNGYSRADRIKVFAYAAYYSFITHDKFGYGKGERNNPDNWFATCSLYLNLALDDGEIIAEVKRNNYYNHEGIKKAFKDAMTFYGIQ